MSDNNKLTSTTNSYTETDYQKAITRMKIGVLDYRNTEDFEKMLEKLGGFDGLVERIKNLFSNDGEIKQEEIINIFVEMWEGLKTGFTKDQIRSAVGRLVGFKSDWIIPIEKLEGIKNTFLSDQTRGHTNAFKDIALQIITKLISIVVKEKNIENIKSAINIKKDYEEYNEKYSSISEYIKVNKIKKPKLTFIINQVSTTGDTAPAAGEGIKGEDFILLIMGYPVNESTFAQIQQMLKLDNESENTIAQGFNKGFTRIQNAMKAGNTKEYQETLKKIIEDSLSELIEEYGFEIKVDAGTFNSINQARIDAQTIYHTVIHAQAEARDIVKPKEELIEVIPSGNGGHMISALFARLASGKKGANIITCNKNDMFHDILERGFFQRPQKESEAIDCPSVSMVIQEPNNIERLFTYAFGQKRAKEIREKYENYEEVHLTTKEKTILKKDLNLHVEVISNTEELETIYDTYIKTSRLICPHTANGVYGLNKYRKKTGDNNTAIVSKTASPWKFISAIASALSGKRGEDLISLYKEYNEIQNTEEGNNELIGIIKKEIEKLGRTFNIGMIPKNLQYLFENSIHEKEAKDPEYFPEITTNEVRLAGTMFRKQVEEVIAQNTSE